MSPVFSQVLLGQRAAVPEPPRDGEKRPRRTQQLPPTALHERLPGNGARVRLPPLHAVGPKVFRREQQPVSHVVVVVGRRLGATRLLVTVTLRATLGMYRSDRLGDGNRPASREHAVREVDVFPIEKVVVVEAANETEQALTDQDAGPADPRLERPSRELSAP